MRARQDDAATIRTVAWKWWAAQCRHDTDPEVAQCYRLLVKKRLYLRNKEPLDEMTKEEKKEKLEETFEVLKEDITDSVQGQV